MQWWWCSLIEAHKYPETQVADREESDKIHALIANRLCRTCF